MRIGELAKKSGCKIETNRFYEREGILPNPPRSVSGYRNYRQAHLEDLILVRHCRSLNIPLAEIKGFLYIRQHPDLSCDDIDQLLERNRHIIKERIAQLSDLDRQFKSLIAIRTNIV